MFVVNGEQYLYPIHTHRNTIPRSLSNNFYFFETSYKCNAIEFIRWNHGTAHVTLFRIHYVCFVSLRFRFYMILSNIKRCKVFIYLVVVASRCCQFFSSFAIPYLDYVKKMLDFFIQCSFAQACCQMDSTKANIFNNFHRRLFINKHIKHSISSQYNTHKKKTGKFIFAVFRGENFFFIDYLKSEWMVFLRMFGWMMCCN